MLRSTMRLASRLALSAAISWSLIPIAAADAPPRAKEDPLKNLLTVPEDGMGDKAWLSGANSIVRDVLAKHPDEDVVICVAGCVSQERVVYAQPAEKPQAPEVSATEAPAAPVAKTDEPTTNEQPVAKTEPEPGAPMMDAATGQSGETPAAAVEIPKPMNAGTGDKANAAADSAMKPGFVPTASEPGAETPAAPMPSGNMAPN